MNILKRWLSYFMILFFLVTLPACSFRQVLREGTPTSAPPVEVQVTADQIAQAMQEDHFYSDYRGNLLLVAGQVHTVNQTDQGKQLELETGLSTKVVCDLGNQPLAVKAGDSVTVQALAADAQRVSPGVLLKNCRMHQ